MKRIIAAFAGLVFFTSTVFAQSTNFGMAPVGSTQTMSVTTGSSTVTLGTSPGNTILVQNTGANTAFVKCASAAATTDFPIQAGWGIALNCPPGNSFSAITASSTTSLYVSQGLNGFALTGGGGSGGGGGSTTANQGTPNTLANGWPVKITDGTNGPAAVKAASTAPAATDQALVVALSPNGINANGQATAANSAPVVIASNQPAFPVTIGAGADPCNSNVAKSSAAINISSATTTALVPVSGSTAVYVCGFSMSISQVITTANTIKFEYGTGTACASGATSLTGTYGTGGITAGTPIVISQGGSGTVFSAPSANGLCAVTTIGASGSFEGVLTYVQQ